MQHIDLKKRKIMLDALARVVAKLRVETNKSQRLLAFDYGLHKSLVNRIENALSEPLLFSFMMLAEILEITYTELMELFVQELPEGFSFLEK